MPTIRIDGEVYTWLQQKARPFEDTPNSVLRRIAGLDVAPSKERQVNTVTNFQPGSKRGKKTPQTSYRKPILKILKKFGGEANRMSVLKELEIEMEGQLTEFDKSDISSGDIRWQKSAEWEVCAMREAKLLKPVSETQRGVWALSQRGAFEAKLK